MNELLSGILPGAHLNFLCIAIRLITICIFCHMTSPVSEHMAEDAHGGTRRSSGRWSYLLLTFALERASCNSCNSMKSLLNILVFLEVQMIGEQPNLNFVQTVIFSLSSASSWKFPEFSSWFYQNLKHFHELCKLRRLRSRQTTPTWPRRSKIKGIKQSG